MTKIFLYGSIDLTKLSPKITEVSDLNYEFQQFAQKSTKNGHIYLSVNASDSQQPSEYSTHYLACKKKGEKAKPMGFEMTPELMSMMGGFTVLRLLTMAGGMMNVKFTKEELLKLNKKLSRIREPKK